MSEGETGAFEPRLEKLVFYVPAPTSAAAAVIDISCAEVRRHVAEKRAASVAEDEPRAAARAADDAAPESLSRTLPLPPSLFASDGFDEDDD